MARGVIFATNKRRGMFAVRCEDGSFSVFEILDSHDPEIGDVVRGELRSLGGETFINESQSSERFDVVVQNYDVAEAALRAQLLL